MKAARLPGAALGANMSQSIGGHARWGFPSAGSAFCPLGTFRCVRGVRPHHALRRLVADCASIIFRPPAAYGLLRNPTQPWLELAPLSRARERLAKQRSKRK